MLILFMKELYYSNKYYNIFSVYDIRYMFATQLDFALILDKFVMRSDYIHLFLYDELRWLKCKQNKQINYYFLLFKDNYCSNLNYYGNLDKFVTSLYENICYENRSEFYKKRQAIDEINRMVLDISNIKHEKLRNKAILNIENKEDFDLFKKIKLFFLITKLKIKLIIRKIYYWIFKK